MSASEVDVGVDGAKSEIKVENSRGHERSAEDFCESSKEIIVDGIVVMVVVGHHSTRDHRPKSIVTTCTCTAAIDIVATDKRDSVFITLHDRHQQGKMMIMIMRNLGSEVHSAFVKGKRKERGGRGNERPPQTHMVAGDVS